MIAALRYAVWEVARWTHTISFGVRATVPSRNNEVLKELANIKVADPTTLEQKLEYTAAIHPNMKVWEYRKLCRNFRNQSTNIQTGVRQVTTARTCPLQWPLTQLPTLWGFLLSWCFRQNYENQSTGEQRWPQSSSLWRGNRY